MRYFAHCILMFSFAAFVFAADHPNHSYQMGTSKKSPNCGYYMLFHWGDQHMLEMIKKKQFTPERKKFFTKHARCRNQLWYAPRRMDTIAFGKHLLCIC